MIDRNYLKETAQAFDFSLSEEQLLKFDRYAELLVEWNQKINLTAITEPKEIVIKHFLDSLLLLKSVNFKNKDSLADVGAGAGFPSLPCKIVREDIDVTLLDSLNKRILFLQELTAALNIPAAAVHIRAEEAGQDPRFREKFDVVTARAVANLRELSEYCLPLVKVGGVFAALKGVGAEEERNDAKRAILLCGGKLQRVDSYQLPDGSRRSILLIQKISQTPTKFPRPTAKMKKQPLNF